MKMTEGDLDKLSKSLAQVRLSDTEKKVMLHNIYEVSEKKPDTVVRSPFVFASVFTSQRLVATFATFTFAIVGTGYAASGSLPGQFLYGIKVNVLEPAALKMTFDEEKRHGYQVHLLHTRVTEMRELQKQAGINTYSEEASHYATERNIKDLETNMAVNTEIKNLEVEAEVKAYNSLISEPYRIRTNFVKEVRDVVEEVVPKINVDKKNGAVMTKETKEVEEVVREVGDRSKATAQEAKKTTEEITREAKEATSETVREAKDTTEEVTKVVDEVVKEVKIKETVKEVQDTVEKVTKPVTDILGL